MYSIKDLLGFIASHPHNFEHPVTHGNALFVTTLIFTICATLSVGIRVLARARCGIKLGWDDVFIIAAMVPVIGLAVVTILGVHSYGWNRHIYDLPPKLAAPNAKIAYSAKILFIIAETLIRESFLFFYARLRTGIRSNKFDMSLNVFHAANILVGVVGLILQATICQPLSLNWSLLTKGSASCRNDEVITFVHGAVFCALDFALCLLPLPILCKLQMPRKRMMGVLALLSGGAVVSTVSAVRNYFVYKSTMAEKDQTWYAYYLWLLVIMEVNLGIICACIPTLRALFMPSAKAQLAARRARQTFSRDSEAQRLNSRGSENSGSQLTTPQRAAFNDHNREFPVITDDGDIIGSPYALGGAGTRCASEAVDAVNRGLAQQGHG